MINREKLFPVYFRIDRSAPMKTTATMFFALITIFFLSTGANAQIKEGGRFETEMEKLSEELDDFDFKDSHHHSDWDWDWKGKDFKEAMADLRVEMDDLKEELSDIDLDFDDASDGIHINVDIDDDFIDNILEEVEEGLEDAADDIAETTEEIREFKTRLSEELESDGYINDADDQYTFKYEDDSIAVDGTEIKGEHYRKYRRLVRNHFNSSCHGSTEFTYYHK